MSRVQLARIVRSVSVAALAAAAAIAVIVPAMAEDSAPPAPGAAAKPEPSKEEAVWIADFDKAVEAAKAQGKDLLVDFTGSDWCSFCMKLDAEVFAKAEFLDAAKKDFVLVALDFPQGEPAKAKVPNAERNAALAAKYDVDGFPTVLFMTTDGDVYAQSGYEAGGAAPWVASMQKHRREGRASLVTAKLIEKEFADAKGDARAPLAEKAVALVEKAGPGAAWVAKVLPAARAALDVDPENAKGLKARAVKAMLKNGTADETVLGEAAKLDPKNQLGIRELAVMAQLAAVRDEDGVRAGAKAIEELDALGPILDKDVKITVYANAAFWNLRVLDDAEKAKAWARKLKAVADPANERLQGLIEACLGPDAEPAAEPADGAKPEGTK